MSGVQETLKRIRSIVARTGDRAERAKHLAETVRSLGNYRRTGVYDVDSEMVSIIAYSSASDGAHARSSGLGAPAYPTFPVTKGLTGSTIREKTTVVVGDVRADPQYALGNHRSYRQSEEQSRVGNDRRGKRACKRLFSERPAIARRMRSSRPAAMDGKIAARYAESLEKKEYPSAPLLKKRSGAGDRAYQLLANTVMILESASRSRVSITSPGECE